MYNRYIPRPDGSYQKSRMPDRSDTRPSQPRQERREPPRQENREQPNQKKPDTESRKTEEACDRGENRKEKPSPPHQSKSPAHKPGASTSAESFLRQLLPKDCDTGDLLIIILLLLMAGDCAEEKNTALLTLALYLFM